jgi:alpha,alpha-trehalose phosphorylase
VIKHPAFPVEPWVVRETHLDIERLAQTESVFALANGHIGLRGNLDEGEPAGLPGTYLNGFYEVRPLPYAEAAYGDPESSQTVVNVTNGKIFRLLVEDEPFDVRYGELRSHERVLDLQSGLLTRTAEWWSPTGRGVRVTSKRLVSFAQRSVAAIEYQVEPLDGEATVVVQSELVANETLPKAGMDPRVSAVLGAPLESRFYGALEQRAILVHTTKSSHLTMACVMDHVIECDVAPDVMAEGMEDIGRLTVATTVRSGAPLRIVKFLSYGWSRQRSVEAVRDQVGAASAAAKRRGWEGLVQDQREYLDDYWQRADIEIDGDPELQQAVRFAMFHILQAGARGERRAIPAKGLTGSGYDGHTFWDTEAYVLGASLAPPHARPGPPAGPGSGPSWRGLPLANDPR